MIYLCNRCKRLTWHENNRCAHCNKLIPSMGKKKELMNMKPTILIADDENSVLLALKQTLERNEMKTLCAHNGLQALKILDQQHEDIDCVVTDFQMPGATGLEIANQCIKKYMPCVVASGDHSNEDKFRGLKVVFLCKPFTNNQLRDAIIEAQNMYQP